MWLILVNYLIWEEKFTYTVLFCGYNYIANTNRLRSCGLNIRSFSACFVGEGRK